MCGKFTQMMSWGELVYHADLLKSDAGAALTITPMRFACVIRMNDKGRREIARMRWGLVPPWEKDPIAGTKRIHARAETIDIKRSFKDAFPRASSCAVDRRVLARMSLWRPQQHKPLLSDLSLCGWLVAAVAAVVVFLILLALFAPGSQCEPLSSLPWLRCG